MSLTARFIKAGLGTRVYYLEQGGYDTHGHQLPRHAPLLEELSASLRAFLDDLAASRLADRVLVLVFSEFGRRVAENGSKGTDHGTAGPVLLAGPCVRPGLHGAYPSLTDLVDGDLKMTVDFRRVYATVLEGWLGLPSKEALGGDLRAPAALPWLIRSIAPRRSRRARLATSPAFSSFFAAARSPQPRQKLQQIGDLLGRHVAKQELRHQRS